MKRLEGKIAVITGASSGVGKTTAAMMAAEGAVVILASRRAEALKETADAISANGGKAFVVPTDISNPESVKALFEKACELCGRVDILVNSAGIIEAGLPSIDKFLDKDLDAMLSTNTKGTMYCMREATRVMLPQKSGSIINIASIAGVVGNGGAAYVASKGAIIAASRHAALRLNSDNIRVNAICPGSINTPMNDSAQVVPDMDLIQQLMKHADITREPMACEPEHVGHLIVYLASDESLPVTGQAIVMDYGVNL